MRDVDICNKLKEGIGLEVPAPAVYTTTLSMLGERIYYIELGS